MSKEGAIYVGSLTANELLLLDGRCRDDVQAKVEQAKLRFQYDSPLIGDLIAEARDRQRLRFVSKPLRRCPLCGTDAGYTHFKSGPRKGQPNLNKPLFIGGYDFADRAVTIRGHVSVGGCKECVDPLLPAIREALAYERCEIPDALMLPGQPKYKKVPVMHCECCDWTGIETQMRQKAAMLEGYYYAGCPKCDAENLVFGRRYINPTGAHEVIRVRGAQ